MPAQNESVDNAWHLGEQWESSCSGNHAFGHAPLMVHCRHDDFEFAFFDWDDERFSCRKIEAK
jgi:hypothetical protein